MEKTSNKQMWVDLFSEFILSKIESSNLSQIEVIDCENFIVVKGRTTSKDILNLNEIKTNFVEEFSEEFRTTHTIDLIEYGCELDEVEELTSIFYNTADLSLCSVETNSLITKSCFPYGYSSKMGKLLYYYSKHIVYNLQTKYNFDKVKLKIVSINHESDFQIFIDSCDTPDESMKSSILDSFHFEYQKLEKKLENCDWRKEIMEEGYEFEFVKEINPNLIII